MQAREKAFSHDSGILGLPGDVSPWDVRFDPTRRNHVELLSNGLVRFVVWAEPDLAQAWLVVRFGDGRVMGYPMAVSGTSSRFLFYQRDLRLDNRVEYSFAFMSSDANPVYLVPSGISVAVERLDRFRLDRDQLMPGGVPEWAKGAVIYQIFPDRFANGDPDNDPAGVVAWDTAPHSRRFHGGDLVGITQRLAYLVALGIDAIYLNPIFASPSNHRYDTVDYFAVDPALGGNAALEDLVVEAHRRKVQVILDASFNHVHPSFFAFSDLVERGKRSRYRDWFVIREWPLRIRIHPGRPTWVQEWMPVWAEQVGIPIEEVSDPGPPVELTYESWYSVPTMPRVDLSNPQARAFMLSVARHWIERFGIDGWRMDVARYVDPDFWNDFRQDVRSVNPDAYLLSEIFGDAGNWLQGDRFDATMNYTFRSICLSFFARRQIDGTEFLDQAVRLVHTYGWETTLANHNLLSSHDTPRFLTEAAGEVWRVVLATVFQLTFPGAPGIYYGDEVGLEGGEDPGCRGAFPWDSPSVATHPVGEAIRAITPLRRRYAALRTGDFRALGAKGGAIAFERRLARSRVVVIINTDENEADFEVTVRRVLWGPVTRHGSSVTVLGRSAAMLLG